MSEDAITEIYGSGSAIGLDTEHATPPVNAYIGVDDVLGVGLATAVPALVIIVFARILLPDGTIVPNQWQFSSASNRNFGYVTFQLPEGFLLSVTASINGAFGSGAQYLQLILTRGNGVNQPKTQILAAGYCSNTTSLSWPPGEISDTSTGPGLIRSITGATPGAAAEISETVPSNAKWRIISIRYSLTTSAAVASRGSMLVFDDGTNAFGTYVPVASQPAGQTCVYTFGAGTTLGQISLNVFSMGLPNDLILTQGFRFRTSTVLMQAGDQYTAPQYLVEEWIYP